MNRLEIAETNNTPHIILDPAEGRYVIEGKSFPEDSKEFYRPVIEHLIELASEPPAEIRFQFNLFYLSSSSIISVKQILTRLAELHEKGTRVAVIWNYDEDDDDIKKTGEDYQKLTKVPFTFHVNA